MAVDYAALAAQIKSGSKSASPPSNKPLSPLDIPQVKQFLSGIKTPADLKRAAGGAFVKTMQTINPANLPQNLEKAAEFGVKSTPAIVKGIVAQGVKSDAIKRKKLVDEYGFTEQNFKNIEQTGTSLDEAMRQAERSKQQAPLVDVGKNLATAADWLSEGTVKPIAKAAVAIPTTIYKDVEAISKLVYELPGAIEASGGDWNKPIAGLKEKIQSVHKQAGDAVTLPWLGNVNMNRLDDKGKLDFVKTLMTEGGTAVDAVLGYANLVAPALRPFRGSLMTNAALRGGTQAAAHEMTQENSNLASIAAAGITGGTLSGIFQGVFNKITRGKTTSEKIAGETGLDINTVEQVRKMSPEMRKKQADMIEQAWLFRADMDNLDSPMKSLADQATDEMRVLNNIKKTAGASIGDVKKGVRLGARQKVDMSGIKDTFKQQLDDLRVGFNPINQVDDIGALNFEKSSIKRLKGDQEMLTNAWDEIKNIDNLDDLIVARDTLRKEMTFGRMNQKVTASEGLMKKLDGAITDMVHKQNPKLADLDDTFSELTKAVNAFQQKTGGKTEFTVDEALDGTNLKNLLRNSLNNTAEENKVLVTKLQALGKKYNLPTLSNLVDLRRMAQTAEDVAQVDLAKGSTTLASRVAQGAMGAKQMPTSPIEGVKNIVNSLKSTQRQKDALLNLLSEPPTSALKEKILKHAITKQVISGLKKVGAITTGGMPQGIVNNLFASIRQALGGDTTAQKADLSQYTSPSGEVDYDALAAKYGGRVAEPEVQPEDVGYD